MNFSEFRKLTMPERKTYPGRHPLLRAWVIYAMQLPASPFSYLLSKCKVTPNQISILRVVICLAVLPLFLFSNWAIGVGLLIFYFALISDCIDGQLARYYGTGSLEGSFVDSVTSAVMFPSMFIAIGLTSYNWSGHIWGLLLVSLILGFRGISGRSKNTVIMKLLFSKNTTLSVEDRSDDDKQLVEDRQATKQVATQKGIKFVVMLLLTDNHFLLLRVAVTMVLGMIFSNSVICIYIFLFGTLFLAARSEIGASLHIYGNKDITRFINKHWSPPSR